jgi:7-cyano-7-deazaguanine synthase
MTDQWLVDPPPVSAPALGEGRTTFDPASDPVRVVLLSGGLDSAALAHWLRPEYTLFIDYGQRPRLAEARAAAAIARQLDLAHANVDIDLRAIGGGLLTDDEENEGWPSPEWWPFRNQLLATIAAAWSIKHIAGATNGLSVVLITGTVATDGKRHVDGTPQFYEKLRTLIEYQEGNITVATPAIALPTEQLIRQSGVNDEVLGWTHSCHRGDVPCGECPGCHKREQVLGDLDRLR